MKQFLIETSARHAHITKEAVKIPACKKPVMKFGKAYKDMINN